MEIDKTVRTLSNLLKNFEKSESCILKEVFARSPNAKELIEKLIDDSRILEFFSDKSDDELRSLHFFLLLNTNLGISEELESNADIGHTIGAIPSITSYVYLMLCTELDLTEYLKEVIEFGPLVIVIHTLNAVEANLKYLQPCYYFSTLATAVAALYARFQRISSSSVPRTLYDIFQVLLLHYKEDEAATDFDSRLSSGYKWLSQLRLVRSASKIRFNKKWMKEPPELYEIQIDAPKDNDTNKSKAIEEFYDRILYKCRAFADILDMNLYMSWHEIEDNESTLQNSIGIEAYKVRSILEKYKKVHSLPAESTELIEILKSVQRKPDKESPMKEEKLDKDELKDRIARESEFNSKFIAEAELLIKKDATVLDFETCKIFIRKLCSNGSLEVREETTKNLILLLLRRMEFAEIACFVGEFIESYGLHNILYQSDINLATHIADLNAVNADDEETSVKVFKEIILLVFSAAPKVLAELIKEACVEKSNRYKIVNLLSTLKPVCLHCSRDLSDLQQPLLMDKVQHFFESEFFQLDVTKRHHFFELMLELCQKNLIQPNSLLHCCLLNSLDVRENSDWLILSEILAFLKKFINDNHKDLKFKPEKMFLQLLRVIESARWNIITFTPERLKACEEGIDVLELIRDLLPTIVHSSKMEELLKSCGYRFSDLTQVYFVDICPSLLNNRIESELISLIRVTLRRSVSRFMREVEEKEASFILRMGELLPRLTSKELQNLVTNFAGEDVTNLTTIFNYISHGITFIGSCAAQYAAMPQANSNAIISCIGQMLNNFLVVLQAKWSLFLAADQKFYFVKHVKRMAAVLQEFPSLLVQPYQFNLIKFVDDSLIKLKALNSDTEMTESMVEEFDRNVRQLFVGFALL